MIKRLIKENILDVHISNNKQNPLRMFSLKPSEDIELSIRYLLSVCLGIAIGMFSHPSQKDLYKLYNSYKIEDVCYTLIQFNSDNKQQTV